MCRCRYHNGCIWNWGVFISISISISISHVSQGQTASNLSFKHVHTIWNGWPRGCLSETASKYFADIKGKIRYLTSNLYCIFNILKSGLSNFWPQLVFQMNFGITISLSSFSPPSPFSSSSPSSPSSLSSPSSSSLSSSLSSSSSSSVTSVKSPVYPYNDALFPLWNFACGDLWQRSSARVAFKRRQSRESTLLYPVSHIYTV